jgi:galactonate dehydratase
MARSELHDLIRCVSAVREAVGDSIDFDLMIKGHGRFNMESASRIAVALQPCSVLWFEEPLFPELFDGMADVRRRAPVPLTAGEWMYSRYQAREDFDRGCGDLIQPDISRVGIRKIRLIAGWAEATSVGFYPQNPIGPITNIPTLNVVACTPNFFLLETMANDVPWRRDISDEEIRVEDGQMMIPTRSGLGIELNEAELVKHPPKPHRLRHCRGDLTAICPAGAKEWFSR